MFRSIAAKSLGSVDDMCRHMSPRISSRPDSTLLQADTPASESSETECAIRTKLFRPTRVDTPKTSVNPNKNAPIKVSFFPTVIPEFMPSLLLSIRTVLIAGKEEVFRQNHLASD